MHEDYERISSMPDARLSLSIVLLLHISALAGVGDPQLRTDHPWYPGELACSTFERLRATQAQVYARVTGREPASDEDRALASWLWRNTHYAHGEPGAEDYWGKGFSPGAPGEAPREYWTGLFAHGFALCGTTHAQWIGEMQALLGHNRARCVGTTGHNSFEVFLTGEAYGDGRWVLLDHDLSTLVYNDDGSALLSIADIAGDHRRLTDRRYKPDRQHGWLVCGLHPGDGGVYDSFRSAEYFAGYAGPPPRVHLRRGETLRRYFEPGLADGRTFVFWGRNYNTQGVPGPERSHTWVNQPEKMHGSREGAGYRPGQARYGNAVYTYQPDFASGDYREAMNETKHDGGTDLVYEFQTPYVIAATPPDDSPWGIYKAGCSRGLIVEGVGSCQVSVSIDRGATWTSAGKWEGQRDLTDLVKGRHQYWLKLRTASGTADVSRLKITTVCQVNASILPRLKDNGTQITFEASDQGLVSAGPGIAQAGPHIVSGGFDSPQVTLELAAPRKAPVAGVYAAAHVRSSNPPSEDVAYRIDYSTDQGRSWQPLVEDWRITRRGIEPADFWSQSFCWGDRSFDTPHQGTVQARFSNTGRESYARAELHLVYRVPNRDATQITYAWTDSAGPHEHSQTIAGNADPSQQSFLVPTGNQVRTRWVQLQPIAR
jgi:hypothetical protein